MPQTISPWDVLTSSLRYEDRADHEECTSTVRANAADTAERVSKLLDRLGLKGDVTSGFRTSASNKSAAGAKRSAHMSGEAVDLHDPQGVIKDAIMANRAVLEECNLYMESPQATPTWCHLQTRPTKSGNRVFIP